MTKSVEMARRILTADAVRARLARETDGDVAGWARRNGLSRAYVYMVLSGDREPSAAICTAIGVRRGTAYWIET